MTNSAMATSRQSTSHTMPATRTNLRTQCRRLPDRYAVARSRHIAAWPRGPEVSWFHASDAPSARQPSTTTSEPSALTFTSGSTGVIALSASVTAEAKPGAWPMPPPSTISSGSTTVITQQTARATSRASAATTATARASPRAAAGTTGGGDAGAARDRLERPPPTGLIGCVVVGQRHERDLARDPVHAAVQPAVEHQPHADAGPDVDEGEALTVAPVAVGPLGQRRRVDVVLKRD